MTMTRPLAAVCVGIATLTCLAPARAADTYPSAPIRIIVPTPPGGGADTFARLTAQAAEPILKTSVIIENRPGAGGTIGTGFVARAKPDGYTLGFEWNGPLTTTPNTTKVSYTRDSYTPIIEIGYASYVMCVAPEFPASNAKEFIEELKRNPGKYTYGNDGAGGTMQLAAERIFAHFGIKQVAVPFKGSGETLQGFLGHQVDIFGGSLQPILPYMKNGTAKCLLLTSNADNPQAPQASGLEAVGAKGLDVGLWYALIGPQGLPADIVDTLYRAYRQAANAPAVLAAMKNNGTTPGTHDPKETKEMIAHEYDALHEVAERLGLAVH